MRRTCRWLALGMVFAFPVTGVSQDEVVVDFCTDCPDRDPDCCIDDTLEVVFDPMDTEDDSVFEYTDFVAGTPIDTAVVIDAVSSDIQGWTFGVKHDAAFLSLIEDSVTTAGTDAEAVARRPLDFTLANQGGTGWIGAYVLNTSRMPVELPSGTRNTVAFARYTLEQDAGPDGTLIELVDKEIAPVPGGSLSELIITVGIQTRFPRKLVQGLVVKQGPAEEDVCDDGIDNDNDGDTDCDDADCADQCPDTEDVCDDGIDNDNDGDTDCDDADCADIAPCVETDCENGADDDGDGLTDCDDPDCAGPSCPTVCPEWAFYFGDTATDAEVAAGGDDSLAIGMRNIAEAFAFQLGVKVTTAGEVSTLEFSGELGADQQRIIDLLITDDNGDSQEPVTPNIATANREPVDVVRGAAIAGFAADDFFARDINPGVGGPGFTVGYVSDLNDETNKIPATPTPADECPLNEVLEIRFTGEPVHRFSRGDVDGNGRLDTSDAVLIVQIAVGNLPERFDCDDVRDTNDDGQADISDALPLLAWLFQRGPRLADPFLACGVDPTGDDLTCAESSAFCP